VPAAQERQVGACGAGVVVPVKGSGWRGACFAWAMPGGWRALCADGRGGVACGGNRRGSQGRRGTVLITSTGAGSPRSQAAAGGGGGGSRVFGCRSPARKPPPACCAAALGLAMALRPCPTETFDPPALAAPTPRKTPPVTSSRAQRVPPPWHSPGLGKHRASPIHLAP